MKSIYEENKSMDFKFILQYILFPINFKYPPMCMWCKCGMLTTCELLLPHLFLVIIFWGRRCCARLRGRKSDLFKLPQKIQGVETCRHALWLQPVLSTTCVRRSLPWGQCADHGSAGEHTPGAQPHKLVGADCQEGVMKQILMMWHSLSNGRWTEKLNYPWLVTNNEYNKVRAASRHLQMRKNMTRTEHCRGVYSKTNVATPDKWTLPHLGLTRVPALLQHCLNLPTLLRPCPQNAAVLTQGSVVVANAYCSQ